MSKHKIPSEKELLEAGVHFGHQMRRWNPKMEKYIFAQRKGIHIIDLEMTKNALKQTCEYLHEVASNGGQIIFVGTKKQARDIIELEAKRCGALYVTERWLGGTITNYHIIKKNLEKLTNLRRQRDEGELLKYTKRERLEFDRIIEKLEKSVGGIVTLKGKPAVVFVIDARRERTAIREANRYGVKVCALVDTNSDPEGIDMLIPGNDDAIRSVALIVKTIADAVEDGYANVKVKAEEPVVEEVAVEVEKVNKVEGKKVKKPEIRKEVKKRGRPAKVKPLPAQAREK